MARQFFTPIALPGDPTAALQAATKQYVDAGDAALIPLSQKATNDGVATLDGTGKLPIGQLTSHAHDASDITVGTLDAARLPKNLFVVSTATLTGGQNLGINAGNNPYPVLIKLTLTTSSTANNVNMTGTPVGAGQVIKLHAYASGGTRGLNFPAPIRTSSGLGRSYTIPSGEVLIAAVEWDDQASAWVLTAATVSAT